MVFNKTVDTTDVTLKVTRGTTAVVGTVTWNDEKTTATIVTTANMINGIHTVTATSAADADMSVSGTTEIKSQYVAEIKILNNAALTGNNGAEAYAYYDVLDQYGESIRHSANIQWSSSTNTSANRTTGKITFTRPVADTRAFVYNENIFITGVHANTGVSVTATLTIGQPQALDRVEFKGFVKTGTTEIVKELPANFKSGAYYMVYTILDQNGNQIDMANPAGDNKVTFITDNILVVEQLDKANERVFVIDGVEYNGIAVVPGSNVDRGGEVNITAISSSTGKQTKLNVAVGADKILTTFNLLGTKTMAADGETVELLFDAMDQNGEKITNFATLARNKVFNQLSFNTSEGRVVLTEQADGTGKLEYVDNAGPAWTSALATDGIDRPVTITSIVVGGGTSSLQIGIQDKARPVAIASVDMDKVLVHEGDTTLQLDNTKDSSFTFVDQYGRTMTNANADAFFAATNAGAVLGTDFSGYKFVVRATYKGTAGNYSVSGDTTIADLLNDATIELDSNSLVTLHADLGLAPITSRTGMALRFEIAKYKLAGPSAGFANAESVSPVKTESLTIVNIASVREFAIKDMNKIYIPTAKTGDLTGDSGTVLLDNTTISNAVTLGAGIPVDHQKTVKVTGKYNNETVVIPASYLAITEAAKVDYTGMTITDGKITGAGGLKWSDFYDATTARYARKDTTDTIKVAVYKDVLQSDVLTTTTKVISLADARPVITTITGPETWTVRPDLTVVSSANVNDRFTTAVVTGTTDKVYNYLDQYGVAIATTNNYRVSNIVENAAGYAANNFSVAGNDSSTLTINGAERGDTFVITVTAVDANGYKVTKDVNVTVGADLKATISSNLGNSYLDLLITPVLEIQRANGLN